MDIGESEKNRCALFAWQFAFYICDDNMTSTVKKINRKKNYWVIWIQVEKRNTNFLTTLAHECRRGDRFSKIHWVSSIFKTFYCLIDKCDLRDLYPWLELRIEKRGFRIPSHLDYNCIFQAIISILKGGLIYDGHFSIMAQSEKKTGF